MEAVIPDVNIGNAGNQRNRSTLLFERAATAIVTFDHHERPAASMKNLMNALLGDVVNHQISLHLPFAARVMLVAANFQAVGRTIHELERPHSIGVRIHDTSSAEAAVVVRLMIAI